MGQVVDILLFVLKYRYLKLIIVSALMFKVMLLKSELDLRAEIMA